MMEFFSAGKPEKVYLSSEQQATWALQMVLFQVEILEAFNGYLFHSPQYIQRNKLFPLPACVMRVGPGLPVIAMY